MNKKVALITGASSGIGESAGVLLQQAGFKVYGAARRVDKMKSLETQGFSTIALDITDEKSTVNCITTIHQQEGSIDILVNNCKDIPFFHTSKRNPEYLSSNMILNDLSALS